jgi:hypothetical protein
MPPTLDEQPDNNEGGTHYHSIRVSRRVFRQLTAPAHIDPAQTPPQAGVGKASVSPQTSNPAPERKPHHFHFLPAFWTITSLVSLMVNVVLIVALILLANLLFTLKSVVETQLIGGLASNFQLMDQAQISTTVNVSANVPAKFNLPLETDTTVTLVKDTEIQGASVSLHTGGLTITNAQTNIVLPTGTILPIHLSLVVPVDQQIPVNLVVPVNIPLNQTQLHQPFVGLQNVVQPYQELLNGIPNNWEAILCGNQPSDLCRAIVP